MSMGVGNGDMHGCLHVCTNVRSVCTTECAYLCLCVYAYICVGMWFCMPVSLSGMTAVTLPGQRVKIGHPLLVGDSSFTTDRV